ncbi:MAG TPA: translation initiation factor IF-2 N-terminal domain-containing protein, partial [Acidimicrobiales bacterium]
MAARIRVYELARELGLTNKETLDLCIALGIGVKSHSSSIEDAQADRVRRKADREGLRRDVQPPEEPMPGRSGAPEARDDVPHKRDLRLITSRPASEQPDPGSYGQSYGQTAAAAHGQPSPPPHRPPADSAAPPISRPAAADGPAGHAAPGGPPAPAGPGPAVPAAPPGPPASAPDASAPSAPPATRPDSGGADVIRSEPLRPEVTRPEGGIAPAPRPD